MKVSLESMVVRRGEWHLAGDALFGEGIHLVSGRIGSGKSTLALTLAGMLPPAEGKVAYDGVNSVMLSMQFPEYHVTGSTVAEEIRSWGLDPHEFICQVGLEGMENESPLILSRGELKRLHLACVCAREWDLLILDEPFASLDCMQKAAMCKQIEEQRQGITIIMTHEQAYLPRVNHIWELSSGDLVDCGEMPEALRRWKGAPPHVLHALSKGCVPENVTLQDAREVLCRMRE